VSDPRERFAFVDDEEMVVLDGLSPAERAAWRAPTTAELIAQSETATAAPGQPDAASPMMRFVETGEGLQIDE
jgi:hypothetical protein